MVFTPGGQAKEGARGTIDYENAKPMPLPEAASTPIPLRGEAGTMPLGVPGFEPGSPGNGGVISNIPADAPPPGSTDNDDLVPEQPQESGTSSHPFSTSRVELTTGNSVSKLYPYRATGKLYFNIGSGTYVCTASLIRRGVVVTAAHCVANFGQNQFYSNWTYVPALNNKTKPYGTWKYAMAVIKGSYYTGTDACYQAGVICTNDVAVLVVKSGKKSYPGTRTGWLGYGWNGWGFSTPSSGPYSGSTIALINQLGYPVSHDDGLMMQRTDSQGFVSTMVSNTVWGSRQTGGSSGGPEIVNLGTAANLSGTDYGAYAGYNIVVGVTSWGYSDATIKQQGASAFTSDNVVALVNAACSGDPLACQ